MTVQQSGWHPHPAHLLWDTQLERMGSLWIALLLSYKHLTAQPQLTPPYSGDPQLPSHGDKQALS